MKAPGTCGNLYNFTGPGGFTGTPTPYIQAHDGAGVQHVGKSDGAREKGLGRFIRNEHQLGLLLGSYISLFVPR